MKEKNSTHMQEFADDLRNYVDRGEQPKDIHAILGDLVLAAEITAAVAKEAEFLVQGQITKETFLVRYKAIEDRFNGKLKG